LKQLPTNEPIQIALITEAMRESSFNFSFRRIKDELGSRHSLSQEIDTVIERNYAKKKEIEI
jgi:hypothetical protein